MSYYSIFHRNILVLSTWGRKWNASKALHDLASRASPVDSTYIYLGDLARPRQADHDAIASWPDGCVAGQILVCLVRRSIPSPRHARPIGPSDILAG